MNVVNLLKHFVITLWEKSIAKKSVAAILGVLLAAYLLEDFTCPVGDDTNFNSARVCVQIDTTNCYGTGIMINRGGQAWVITAAHVVDDVRTTNGFTPVKIVTRIAGQQSYTADVVVYSNAETGEDIALLRVRRSGEWPYSATFAGPEPPLPGTRVFHAGCIPGMEGLNSCTEGIVGLTGLFYEDKEYDQTTFASWPGSSGGGVFDSEGRCVGLVVRGAVLGSSLIVPARRIIAWAKQNKLEWLLDPDLPVPPGCLRRADIGPTLTFW